MSQTTKTHMATKPMRMRGTRSDIKSAISVMVYLFT
jgi:hypothetical protein